MSETNGAEFTTVRNKLRQVGSVLIGAGLVDLVILMISLVNGWGYVSAFSLFAILCGIQLRKGDWKMARIAALFSAFFATLIAGFSLLFFVFTSRDTFAFYFKQAGQLAWPSVILLTGFLAVLLWAYRQLTSPPIETHLLALESDYLQWRKNPRSGFIIGLILVILMGLSVVISTPHL
jgi:hypothetical protein